MKAVTQRSVFGTSLRTAPCLTPLRVRDTLRIQNHKNEAGVDAPLAIAGLAVSSTLLASQPVEAAQEFATIAAGDTRLGAVLFLFVPAIAWVLFNITGPASRQLAKMQDGKAAPATPRSAPRPVGRKAPPKKPLFAKKPPVKQPVAKKPPVKQPVAKKPPVKQPVAKQPAQKKWSFFGRG